MSTYHADLHEHSHSDESLASSPVPEKWIPWAVMAMATTLIVAGFLILYSFAP